MRRSTFGLVPGLALALVLAACGADDSASGFETSAADAGGGASPNAAEQDAGPGPEKEIESDYEAPVATGHVVWIANPKSGRVALVDAATLQVRTVEAGNGPTYVASVPAQPVDTTLVLNVLSEDATLLKAGASDIGVTTFKTAKQANAMAFSSDGRFAIVWADARKAAAPTKTEGFQDLAVLDLTTGTSTILAVGYRPVAVGFAEGQPRAYAVTQDGVALIDLAGAPLVKKNVAISDTPTEDPGTRDVFVTKDGTRAFVRRDESDKITIVGLDDDTRTDLQLSGPVTDLDLSDTGDRAVAVVRDTAEVTVIPIADPTKKTSVTDTGETIGSVAIVPGGAKALLYSNAALVERFSILDVAQSAFRTVRLYSPVLGIFSTPDAAHAVVLHDAAPPGAFSVVPISETLPAKIVATDAPPTAVAMTNEHAIVAERDDDTKTYGVYIVTMPQLMDKHYPLASPPIAVGAVPEAKRAYVAQQHPDGRLTFIDLETGLARTLTGFELSSRVVDGSKP